MNDSTVPDRRPKTSTEDLEKDSIPQRLLFPNRKRVHPIFLDDKGELVDLLPDHNHEGAVVIPEKRKPPEWPASGPAPEAIAYSLDWMRLATFACMVEWNGHKADGAGRILADTTWHHYVDLNLARFENTALWPTIKQLYTNMVWRLAPRKLEKPLVKEALEWVRTYPGLDLDAETGEVRVRARSLLARRLPATLYHGLIDDVLAEGGADELLHAAPGLLDHLVFVLLRGEQADPMERLHDLLKGSGFDVMAIEHYLAVTRHLEHHNLVEVSALPRPAPRSSVLERALASYKRSSEALSSTLSIRGSRK